MSLRPADKVVLAYVGVSSVIAVMHLSLLPDARWVLLANALCVVLVALVTRPGQGRFGAAAADLYPLVLVLALYGAIDLLTGHGLVRTHELAVQQWEAALFGGQVSREWWQQAPSRFWSTVLHAVYVSYYLVIPAGPLYFLFRGEREHLRRTILALTITYAVCFAIFLVFPVAGPNYSFPPPSAEFRSNAPARLAYLLLAGGSSYGAAFPSSHVAASLVAAGTVFMGSRRLGAVLLVPSLLLTVAVVYCQMHYAVDSVAGVLMAAAVMAWVILRERASQAPVGSDRPGNTERG